jgi:putative ABC transport system permease protein
MFGDFAQASGEDVPKGIEQADVTRLGLYLISESDFNAVRAMRGLGPVSVGADGYLLATDMPDLAGLYAHALENGKTVVIAGRTLHPAQTTVYTGQDAKWRNTSFTSENPGTIIVPDALLVGAFPYQTNIGLDYSVDTETGDALVGSVSKVDDSMSHYVLQDGLKVGVISSKDTRTELLSQSLGATGVVSYLSIYIGFVLVVSCAAILAIQQLSEASDSASRFRLLSELGCPRRLSNRSLLVQTLVAFLAPLVVGLAHSICALQSVIPLVRLFGALDIGETAGVTAAMFLVVYGAYFLVTYGVAKGVVNARAVEARG